MYKQNLVKWNIRKNVFGVASITSLTQYNHVTAARDVSIWHGKQEPGKKRSIKNWN